MLLLRIRITGCVGWAIECVQQGQLVVGCGRKRMETADGFPFTHQSLAVWMLIVKRRRRVAPTLVATRRRCCRTAGRHRIQTVVVIVDVVTLIFIGSECYQSG